MGGRRVARLAAYATLVTTLALSTAATLAPTAAFAAAAVSSIKASPSPIPAGKTLAVSGTVFGWTAQCEIVIDASQVPTSTCFVADDTLTGTLTVPSNYAAATYTITACSPECSPPNTFRTRIAVAKPPLTASTTVDVDPAAAPTPQPTVAQPTAAQPTAARPTLVQPTPVPTRTVVIPVPVPKPAKPRNYVPIYIAGGVTLVVLIAVLAAGHAWMQRRRRLARRWYHDHVRLASKPTFETGFDGAGSIPLPEVHMAVRDTRLQTCELEEAVAQ